MNTVSKPTTTFSGRGIGRGVAVGRLNFYRRADRDPDMTIRRSRSASEEIRILKNAIQKASDQLDLLYSKTLKSAGEQEAKIFDDGKC